MKRLLLGISVVLVAILVAQWKDWPDPLPQLGEQELAAAAEGVPAVAAPAIAGLDATSLRPESDYVTVLERPLFLPDRRPSPEEPAADTENDQFAEASEVSKLDVKATLIRTPDDASVWLQDPTNNELVRLRLRDEYQGWTVAKINPDRILLERDGVTEALTVFDFSRPSEPAGRPRAPLGQRPGVVPKPSRPPLPTAPSRGEK